MFFQICEASQSDLEKSMPSQSDKNFARICRLIDRESTDV